MLESTVVFLKDKCKLSYHEIAVLLNRDDRTIWTSYNKAKKKGGKKRYPPEAVIQAVWRHHVDRYNDSDTDVKYLA